MLGIVRLSEVGAVGWLARPSVLAGQLAGVLAGGFAAVALPLLVAVIGEEKLAATAALASLGPQAHRELKPPRSQKELKQNKSREEGPRTKKEEAIWREAVEENPGEEDGISNRRIYTIFIPPLT
jgi:hypothetical protein